MVYFDVSDAVVQMFSYLWLTDNVTNQSLGKIKNQGRPTFNTNTFFQD